MTALTTPAARFEPGPWYALPRWKKAIVWLRYKLPQFAIACRWFPLWCWRWFVTYRHAERGEYGGKRVGLFVTLYPPHSLFRLVLADADFKMGRYSTMVWEEGETE